MAIYSGCDYLDSIKGVGLSTVLSYFPEEESLLIEKIEDRYENWLNSLESKMGFNKRFLPENCDSLDEYFALYN